MKIPRYLAGELDGADHHWCSCSHVLRFIIISVLAPVFGASNGTYTDYPHEPLLKDL